MTPRINEYIFKKLNFIDQIKLKQINKAYYKLPKISLKNLSKKIKEKLTDNIIIKYSLVDIKKEMKKINDNTEILIKKAIAGELEVVKYLIILGADIHENNERALRWCASNGRLKMVEFLVQCGANIHANDEEALRLSAANGNMKMIKFLIKCGADIHARDDYALRMSAENYHFKVVNYLIKCGAYVNLDPQTKRFILDNIGDPRYFK